MELRVSLTFGLAGACVAGMCGAATAASLQPVTSWGASGVPSYVSMYIYVPDKLATDPPILVVSHYCGGNAQGVFGEAQGGGIVAAADKYGFIMVFPQNNPIGTSSGTGRNCWDVGSNASLTHNGGGDTQAIAEMVSYTISKYGADADRVYATGTSSGAMMTEALLAVYPDVFKAGAEFSGVPAGCWADQYSASNQWSGPCAGGMDTMTAQAWGNAVGAMYPGYSGPRPRVQLWHGDADPTINFANQTQAILEWTNVLGLPSNPTTTTTVSFSNHSWTHASWQDTCGSTVLDAWSEANGPHGTDANLNATYVIPFLGLDKTGAVDPEVAQCGGDGGAGGKAGSAGATGAAGTGGAGGAGGRGGKGGGGGVAGEAAGGRPGIGGAAGGGAGGKGTGGSGGSTGSGGNPEAGGRGGAGSGGATGGTGNVGNGGAATTGETNSQDGCSCALGRAQSGRGSGRGAAISTGLAIFALARRRRRPGKRTIGLLVFALVAAIGAGAAHATSYTITVDASKQTTGNPHFWSATVGTGTASLTLRSDLETHYKIGNREAGFQRVRGHGVLNDDMGIYKGPGSYSWTNFDKYLTAISQAGMRPIMEMDFMPTALALNGSSRDIYKNATDYKNFITAVAQHCVDKFGMSDVSQWYWEIWNEPDYSGFWNGSNSSEDTSAKMTEYYGLYDNAVAAITSVIPNALVGGPATTQASPIPAFLQHCKSAGTRVTFASSHVYPGGAAGGTSADANTLVTDNNSRISDITGAGYTTSQVLSFNTEWNSSYSGQGGGTGDNVTSMDNNWNVGFILKGAKLLSDKNSGNTPPLAVFSYWVLSDVFDENTGPSGSYILAHDSGQLPFGQVFGLMTAQGVRKAAFNAFKMLNMLGPVRLLSGGGTGSDGVDAMATTSQSGDSLQILVYDYYAKLSSTGSDMVTINVSNLPSALAGKQVFVTQYLVDATHSNPYSVWQGQSSPGSPSETQWQAMKAAQHLALAQPVATTTLTTAYSTAFSINRQAGTLLVVSTKRPVTGRDGLGTLEGEDYDGQSGATKEDSNDADLGQSISATSGASVFYDVVDFSDAGVSSVQLRVQAASATTLELHADSATGTLIGKCAVAATGTSWATQSCTLTPLSGVHTLYVLFNGAAHLNWLLFQGAGGAQTGTGGTGGGIGTGGSGSGGTSGTGGSGGTLTGTGGSGIGTGGSGTGTGGNATSSGGDSGTGSGGSSVGSTGGTPGTGGGSPDAGGKSSGCACRVEDDRGPSAATLILALLVAAGAHRRRVRRRP
jgi:poly(hydroxyalkanoate) depolymerase family esterase